MAKIDLGQSLGILANLSVLAGVIFLAFEIQQNTEATQAQTRDSVSEKLITMAGWIANNGELAEILDRATRGEPLDSTENLRYALWNVAQHRVWENSFYQYERGFFDSEEFEPRRRRWEINMVPELARISWRQMRMDFSSGYRQEIDEIVERIEAAN